MVSGIIVADVGVVIVVTIGVGIIVAGMTVGICHWTDLLRGNKRHCAWLIQWYQHD